MDDADVSDEYRNILERIFGDDQPTDTDQRERLTPAGIARVMRQSAADARRADEDEYRRRIEDSGDALAAIRTPDDGVFTTVSTAQLQAAVRHISTALDR